MEADAPVQVMRPTLAAVALTFTLYPAAVPRAGAQSLAGLGNTPTIGAVLPAFEARALDGSLKRFDYPKGKTTVLLFFLSSCPTCHKMIPEWNRAFAKRAPQVEIWGVILDQEPPGFFDLLPVAFPVVRSPGVEFTRTHNINRVPLTLRVGPGGKIEDLSLGQIDPIRLGELLRP
jgi:thiol-disulfide isomerase/thioredoxin